MPTLLSIGHGYSAQALGRRLVAEGWRVIGTSRERRDEPGVEMRVWPGDDLVGRHRRGHPHPDLGGAGAGGRPCAASRSGRRWRRRPRSGSATSRPPASTATAAAAGWTRPRPSTPATARGRARVEAEAAWAATGLPLHVFRLAGIYGPGRGPFEKIRSGRARRIVKPGQVFSRIHVDDIAQVLAASMAAPAPGA